MKIKRPRHTAKLLRAELKDIARQCRKCDRYPGSEELCVDCPLLARSVVILDLCRKEAEKRGVLQFSDLPSGDA